RRYHFTSPALHYALPIWAFVPLPEAAVCPTSDGFYPATTRGGMFAALRECRTNRPVRRAILENPRYAPPLRHCRFLVVDRCRRRLRTACRIACAAITAQRRAGCRRYGHGGVH